MRERERVGVSCPHLRDLMNITKLQERRVEFDRGITVANDPAALCKKLGPAALKLVRSATLVLDEKLEAVTSASPVWTSEAKA